MATKAAIIGDDTRDKIERQKAFWSLAELLELVVVNITPEDLAGKMSVVKVLSSHLIPITFGYGMEPWEHPAVKQLTDLCCKRGARRGVHFFA